MHPPTTPYTRIPHTYTTPTPYTQTDTHTLAYKEELPRPGGLAVWNMGWDTQRGAHTHWVGETARASTRGPVGTVLPDPVFPPEASGCLSGARINEAKQLVFLQPGVTQTGQGCSLSLIQGADANQLA